MMSSCSCRVWHARKRSIPARRPSAAARGTAPESYFTLSDSSFGHRMCFSAPISMSSVITTPSPNRRFLRKCVTAFSLHDAGTCARGSIAGTNRCATNAEATLAETAARNGAISIDSKRDMWCGKEGRASWLSSLVSPCPGQCLAHPATPFACRFSMKEEPHFAAVWNLDP